MTWDDNIIPGNCEGNFTIVRTWRCTDECGNFSECDQTIVVHDFTPPTIECPEKQDIEWVIGLDVSDPGNTGGFATCTDLCDENPNVTWTDNVIPGNCEGSFTIVRTWRCTDECGNFSECEQTIVVHDFTPPTIECPPDQDIEWVTGFDASDPDNTGGFAFCIDECDPNPNITWTDNLMPGNCDGNFTIERTWRCTDECGNFSECEQTIVVHDNTPPTVVCPPDQDIEWVTGFDASDPNNTGGFATCTDDCDLNPVVIWDDNIIQGDCPGNFTIERTWTCTDDCGNVDQCVQTIMVHDETPPVISCPPDQEIEWVFGFDISDPANTGGFATCTDDCDPNPVVTWDDNIIQGDCPGNFTIERTWTCTDDCGNSSECVQIIVVDDTTPPTVVCPPKQDIEWVNGFDASDPANTGGFATCSDDCDPNPVVTWDDNIIPGNCEGNFTIVRTWRCTDECGNFSECDQTIVVHDFTPPTIECPPKQDIEWTADFDISDPNNTGGFAICTDECDENPNVTWTDNIIPGNCEGNFTVERTWRCTDECGNFSECVQVIVVHDFTNPVIDCPPDQDIEWTTGFDASDPANTGGFATCTDECDDNPTITWTDNLMPGDCDGNFVIERTWRCTDECGNFSECMQTIVVHDETPPVITCPPHQDIEWFTGLDASDPANTGGFATCTDECDENPNVTFTDNLTPGDCEGNFTIERTWTCTDDCGNVDQCVQTIMVHDETPPVISCPPDQEIEWVTGFDVSDPANTGGFATCTDDCDTDPNVTWNDVTTTGSCAGNFTIERTWICTDDCGNSSECVQIIVVADTAPPTIECPPKIDVEWFLDFDLDPANTGGFATCSDDCDPNPNVTYTDNILPGQCEGNFTVERTWTCTDECGNSSECIQVIVVHDFTPPVIECPLKQDIEWVNGLDVNDPNNTGGFATCIDLCDENPNITWTDNVIPGNCEGSFTIVRTWRCTDDCFNFSECNQTIVVHDFTPPAIECPPDQDIEWVTGFDASDPANTGGFAFCIDECDPNPNITWTDNLMPGNCDGNFTIERTWRCTDECGNFSECEQTIVVHDNTPPTVVCPPDQDIEWVTGFDASDPNNTGGFATCTDECDLNPVVIWNDNIIQGDCAGEFLIERTWTCTDDCGNVDQCVQTIVVHDETPPVISCPPDQEIEWVFGFDISDPANTGGFATCTDDCDLNPQVTWNDNLIQGDCPGNFTVERTWTCTDECGNFSVCMQIIVVADTAPPTIECPPKQDIEWITGFDASDPANTGGFATCTDDCDTDPNVIWNDNIIPGNCAGNFTVERTWTCTDECGNSSECIQVIVVHDFTPPTVDCPPDQNIEWVFGFDASDPNNTGGFAACTDDCDENPIVTHTDNLIPGDCAGNFTIERTWRCTDECNNSSECVQMIEVHDLTDPTIVCPPDQDLEWTTGFDATDPANTGGFATCTDDCDPNPDITWTDLTLPGNCAGNFTILRTWTCTDECDNFSECLQIIMVHDLTNPTIVCPPNQDIEWFQGFDVSDPNNTGGFATCTDECDTDPNVTWTDNLIQGNCAGNFTIERTWTCTDECSNVDQCVQTIVVHDETPPVISCPPDQEIEWITGFDVQRSE